MSDRLIEGMTAIAGALNVSLRKAHYLVPEMKQSGILIKKRKRLRSGRQVEMNCVWESALRRWTMARGRI